VEGQFQGANGNNIKTCQTRRGLILPGDGADAPDADFTAAVTIMNDGVDLHKDGKKDEYYKDGKKHKGEPDSSSKKNSHSKKAKKAKQPESSGSESSGDSSEESEEGDTSNPPPSSKGAKVRKGAQKRKR